MPAITPADITRLERSLTDAQAASHRAMDRKRALQPGSTRARVTTANANWARAAEHRDRCAERLDAARAAYVAQHARAPIAVDPDRDSLSDVLAELGFTHWEAGNGRHDIRLDGVLVCVATAGETWAWLRGVRLIVERYDARSRSTDPAIRRLPCTSAVSCTEADACPERAP